MDRIIGGQFSFPKTKKKRELKLPQTKQLQSSGMMCCLVVLVACFCTLHVSFYIPRFLQLKWWVWWVSLKKFSFRDLFRCPALVSLLFVPPIRWGMCGLFMSNILLGTYSFRSEGILPFTQNNPSSVVTQPLRDMPPTTIKEKQEVEKRVRL